VHVNIGAGDVATYSATRPGAQAGWGLFTVPHLVDKPDYTFSWEERK